MLNATIRRKPNIIWVRSHGESSYDTERRGRKIAVTILLICVGSCAALSPEPTVEKEETESSADRAPPPPSTERLPAAVARSPDGTKPRLVVVISVDQMRADYIADKRDGDVKRALRPYYRSGFDILLTEGTVFTEARHQHALTETAPGHAVISTGLFPCHHGIVSNEWLERQDWKPVEAVKDAGPVAPGVVEQARRSPDRLLQSTIGDILKNQDKTKDPDRKSRVASVAQKDRAAILMGGMNADISVWFDTQTGRWITSAHYEPTRPDWLRDLNKELAIDQYRYPALTWYRLLTPTSKSFKSTARKDKFDKEAAGYPGLFPTTTFPHKLEYPYGDISDGKPYELIGKSPIGDLITAKAVKGVIASLDLGDDPATDLLWVGFSAPDLIGHLFGPFSQEMMDEYLRLDHVIGELIRHLDKEIGRDQYLLVLTADHGAPPIPEYALKELKGNWARVDKKKFDKAVQEKFKAQGGGVALVKSHEDVTGFYIDKAQLGGRTLPDVEKALVRSIKSTTPFNSSVEEVFTGSLLSTCLPSTDTSVPAAYSRSYYKDRSPDVIVQFKEKHMLSAYPTGTTHGSPYDYDTHVPLIVFGNGTKKQVDDDPVGPVDIAPTIAELLGLKVKDLDGTSFLGRTR